MALFSGLVLAALFLRRELPAPDDDDAGLGVLSGPAPSAAPPRAASAMSLPKRVLLRATGALGVLIAVCGVGLWVILVVPSWRDWFATTGDCSDSATSATSYACTGTQDAVALLGGGFVAILCGLLLAVLFLRRELPGDGDAAGDGPLAVRSTVIGPAPPAPVAPPATWVGPGRARVIDASEDPRLREEVLATLVARGVIDESEARRMR